MPTKILCLCGSPRPTGNTQTLVDRFAEGASEAGAEVEIVRSFDLDIRPCRGCLRCNIIGRCAIKGDDWPPLAESFCKADAVLFASPVYFHHVTGNLKLVIDRIRSLLHVRMVPGGIGLEHTPRYGPHKAYGLILVQGAQGEHGIREVRELIEFIAGLGGAPVPVDVLVGNRLGISGQVRMNAAELASIYEKLGLPTDGAPEHARYNDELRDKARDMGKRMAERLQGV
jgi:multimeric flavodoxin WrbA